MKSKLRSVHRWVSLAVATFWVLQALSGIFLVFHWELADALVPGETRPFEIDGFSRRLDAIEAQGTEFAISSIWTSAGTPGRFKITVYDAWEGVASVLLVDGAGNVLHERSLARPWRNGGWIDKIASFHQTLLAGDVGHSLIGLSGLLLLTNIGLGLTLAWPKRGQWGRALRPRVARLNTAGLYAWHRALGLWVGPLALVTVTCGTLLTFEDKVAAWVGAEPLAPTVTEDVADSTVESGSSMGRVRPGDAIATALSQYPGSSLAGVAFPDDENAFYRIRVLQPEELRRAYGTTTVFVSARSGQVIGNFDALAQPPARRFMDTLFPIHTGEVGGIVGRLAIVGIGAWLITMIVFGVSLWLRRRAPAGTTSAAARERA
jgi:uncharacterized iron-regulated membrane protein